MGWDRISKQFLLFIISDVEGSSALPFLSYSKEGRCGRASILYGINLREALASIPATGSAVLGSNHLPLEQSANLAKHALSHA